MTRYQCIREILDTFDYYDAYVAHLDAWDPDTPVKRWTAEKNFRIRLYGVESSRDVTESAPGENHESRRRIFQRVYRAYVFKGVREGHEAGIDYLSICYAFCRRIAALERDDPWRGFSMHTYAMLKTGRPLTIYVKPDIGNPERVSLKKKLAFLRAERRKRREFTEFTEVH